MEPGGAGGVGDRVEVRENLTVSGLLDGVAAPERAIVEQVTAATRA